MVLETALLKNIMEVFNNEIYCTNHYQFTGGYGAHYSIEALHNPDYMTMTDVLPVSALVSSYLLLSLAWPIRCVHFHQASL